MHRARPPVTVLSLLALASSALGGAQVAFRAVPAVVPAQAKDVKPVEEWRGKFANEKDEPLMEEAPKSGHIADAKAWTRLWKAWRFAKEQPAIDFEKHIVLVSVAGGAVNTWTRATIELTAKGDLRPVASATARAGPGFLYLIRVVARAGVKTIDGKPIAGK